MHEPSNITVARELIDEAYKRAVKARQCVIASPMHHANPDYEQVILSRLIDAALVLKDIQAMLPKLFEDR